MKNWLRIVLYMALLPSHVGAQEAAGKAASCQAVPELPYRVAPNFFKFPKGMIAGGPSSEESFA